MFKLFESFKNDNLNHNQKELKICRSRLTDQQYLKHMIPHHQVAIDISRMLQKKSQSPVMQEILRKLIWTQEYEIGMMKMQLPEDISTTDCKTNDYKPSVADFTQPNKLKLTTTYCDPNFFSPKAHMQHLHHMDLNDKMYIQHMIPHHQVAVDMSKVLLKYTQSDFMIYLANRIIQSQQAEIILLSNLLQNSYNEQSQLVRK
tara:strand:+ start:185 stop:790 length:606 start_codon:yes stop_codon:yes gene_type:complete